MNTSFNPFSKKLDACEASDLAVLREVSEGWYIEYKREVPNSAAIAKSVSALANTHGGWVFYGIAERSKEESVAGDYPGIENAELDTYLQRIRQAVAGSMNPACHYDVKHFPGPCPEIGLCEGRSIIAIFVPQSLEAPHVHSKGFIYRRVADGSEPVPENDRYMLEKLFDRGRKLTDFYREWLADDPELSKGEGEIPHLRLMLMPAESGASYNNRMLDIDEFQEILSRTEGRIAHLPFDSIYPRAGGLVARQCAGGNPIASRPTWIVHEDLRSDVIFPLSYCEGSVSQLRSYLEGYDNAKEFTDIIRLASIERAKVVDFNYVLNILKGVMAVQHDIQALAGLSGGMLFKAKFLSVWRAIPFLDMDEYIDLARTSGVPVSLSEQSVSPPGYDLKSFQQIDEYEHIASGQRTSVQGMHAFANLTEAFGFPLMHMLRTAARTDNRTVLSKIFDNLEHAGMRAGEVTKRRKENEGFL